MPAATSPPPDSSAYLLSYRSQDHAEDRRLDSQHAVIKHAILDGHLIHPSIPLPSLSSIADIACGTGIWLDDVRKTHFPSAPSPAPLLVGFDVNPHAFDTSLAPAITLLEHDCTQPFPACYLGKFDLVNMRGLAYAVPQEGFSRLLAHAAALLRPGGHLQWLETETRLFRQVPVTGAFTEAIATINAERRSRGLVTDMPRFMLQEMLRIGAEQVPQSDELPVSILLFSLLQGGICRDLERKGDEVNRRFSATVLESVKLLLAAPLKKSLSDREKEYIHRLIDAVAADMENEEIIAGGIFPFLIAQKSLQ